MVQCREPESGTTANDNSMLKPGSESLVNQFALYPGLLTWNGLISGLFSIGKPGYWERIEFRENNSTG
ncbi:hypothetical protein VTN96DRAFT_5175 [Rasamsonia emersonii]